MHQTQTKKFNQGIIVPSITFGLIGMSCFLLFCIVHRLFKDIYSPRRLLNRGRPPSISKGFLSWIYVVYKTKEDFLINTVGCDGVMLLRFFKLGYQIFFVQSIIGVGVIAPLNFYSNPPTLNNSTWFDLEEILIPAVSIDNMPKQSPFLKVILGFCWIFSFITLGFLISYYRGFLTLKLQYDEFALKRTRLSKIEMRSVMVFGVPHELRNELELTRYFENLCIGKVDQVVLCRNWSLLQKAVQQRFYFLEKLESLVTRHGKSSFLGDSNAPFGPNNDSSEVIVAEVKRRFYGLLHRPTHKIGLWGIMGQRVDSVDYYCDLFLTWDRTVKSLRKTPENSSSTGIAFVTFESPMSATIASQCVVHSSAFSCMIRMAPEPRDLNWANLSAKSAHSYSKFFRSLVAVSSMFLMVTSSTFVVSSIAALIDLQQLGVYVPFIGKIIQDLPKAWVQLIQGVIPTLLLATWNSCLPSVLLRTVLLTIVLCHFQGLEAESWIQMSLLSKYFFYLVWNTVFVNFFYLLWNSLFSIEKNQSFQRVLEKLVQMLPESSATMINYTILAAFGSLPAQLLLAAPLIMTWFYRLSPWSTSTPRQISNAYYPSILTFINYGVIYPIAMLIFIIGCIYGLITPIILPFCCVFFAIGYFIYKYILMYVHIPCYESKGIATPYIVNRCLVGVGVQQVAMMGVLVLKTMEPAESILTRNPTAWSEFAKMIIGILPIFGIIYFVYQLLEKAYKKQIRNVPLQVLGSAQRSFTETQQQTQISSESYSLELSNVRSNRLSIFTQHSFPQIRPEHDVNIDIDEEQGVDDDLLDEETYDTLQGESRPFLNNRASKHSILDPTLNTKSPFIDPNDTEAIDISFQHSNYEPIETQTSMLQHIEPPCQRVSGVLDIPIGAAMLQYGEQNDSTEDYQLHTYLHPCLVGKLPICWIPESNHFQTFRMEQEQEQLKWMKRNRFRQKWGVENIPTDTVQVGRFKAFIDGFVSWIHLTIS